MRRVLFFLGFGFGVLAVPDSPVDELRGILARGTDPVLDSSFVAELRDLALITRSIEWGASSEDIQAISGVLGILKKGVAALEKKGAGEATTKAFIKVILFLSYLKEESLLKGYNKDLLSDLLKGYLEKGFSEEILRQILERHGVGHDKHGLFRKLLTGI
ncbi:MAG: uncharacterized protein A8A55_1844 [Amphiamblys sp. WSBS2006]|nr:MAG: uncharacterized protein A8A55_1844 [Amphiamblys sp. WSBS2006]